MNPKDFNASCRGHLLFTAPLLILTTCATPSARQAAAPTRPDPLTPPTVSLSASDWRAVSEDCDARLQAGNIDQAETLSRRLTVAPPAGADSAAELAALGDGFARAGRFEPANSLARAALAVRESLAANGGGMSAQMDVALALNVVARIELDGKKPAEALALLGRSTSVVISLVGVECAELVPPLVMSAEAFRSLGNAERADAFYERALKLAQTVQPGTPEESKLTAEYLDFLKERHRDDRVREISEDATWRKLFQAAGRASALHHYDEAEKSGLEAIRRASAFGVADPRLCRSRVQLAATYLHESQPGTAAELLRRAITDTESGGHTNTPDLIPPLDALAALCSALPGGNIEAATAAERSLALAMTASASDPADIAARSRALALLYSKLGNTNRAEVLYLQALQQTRAAGGDLPDCMLSLADFYRANHRCPDAERTAGEGIALLEPSAAGVDANTPLTLAAALSTLGRIQLDCGNSARAEASFQRSVSLMESSLGSENPDLVEPLISLAEAQCANGREAHAEDNFRRALKLAEQGLSPNAIELAPILDGYARLLRTLRRSSEAEQLAARAGQLRAAAAMP